MNAGAEREDLLDLLVKRASEGLNAEESARLVSLQASQPDALEEDFDTTVAAIWLAGHSRSTALPAHLARSILADAPNASRSSWITSRAAGWYSAAACLALAVAGWWPRLGGDVPAITVTAPASAEQQRDALIRSGRAIQAAWAPGTDAAGGALVGDVVFDPVTQRGFLRFRGIPANDPRLEQYQLWIADAGRTPPEPVDGGVFDTPQAAAGGDLIIPFEAKLSVSKPAAFVVTVEQPGGVVVSKQQRVLALAKVAGT
ncbi:MAG: anti-sigma factor [Vicinamibacterales bacterium]